jgi:sugar phosphate isomerase/epimerase
MNRREFLCSASLMPFVAGTLSRAAESKGQINKVGMQLYTVRELLKADFEGTLAKVAQIGYKEVEFAGYFDHTPRDVRSMLDRNGLAAPSAHVPYDVLTDKWPGVLDAAHTVGHTYIVCPWIDDAIRKQPEGWKRAAETFNRAATISQKVGIQFAYHNHHFEFVPVEGGRMAYDLLLEETDPNLVKMEMDLCWVNVAGQDPRKYFERYPGRFPLVHVKDVKRIPPKEGTTPVPFEKVFPELTAIGKGVIDWKQILAESKKAGIEHYFVENDFPVSPFDFLQASYTYLRDLRF